MKQTYYLFNPGRMSRKDNTLQLQIFDEEGSVQQTRYLPVENVDELYVFGALEANSALYNFLGQNHISVHFFDYHENYTGSFFSRDYLLSGKVLLAQTDHYKSKKKRMVIAQRILDGASFNMIKNLRYYNSRGKDLTEIIEAMEALAARIGSTTEIDELMGIEGNIRRTYYEAFNLIISDFAMEGRSYRPPLNEVNALISFGNMMCYSQCLRAIHQTQLNPLVSFLHQPGERRFSLSLDLAEIFKPILVDRVIFKLLNRKEIQESDFDMKVNSCLLKEKGKKKFVQAFEERLAETFKHRGLGRNVSYKHVIKLECYNLVKHILNDEEYKPFKMYW